MPAGETVTDGLRWIRARPTVVALLVGTLAVGWTSDPFSTLMPAMAERFGYGETVVGLLVGAFGLGAAITAPGSDRIRERLGRGRVTGLGLAISAVGLVTLAAAPVVHVGLIGAAISGSGFLLGVTSTNTELQRGIPDALRGRVMAIWSVAFLGCRPVAAVVDGSIADATDPRVALARGGRRGHWCVGVHVGPSTDRRRDQRARLNGTLALTAVDQRRGTTFNQR